MAVAPTHFTSLARLYYDQPGLTTSPLVMCELSMSGIDGDGRHHPPASLKIDDLHKCSCLCLLHSVSLEQLPNKEEFSPDIRLSPQSEPMSP